MAFFYGLGTFLSDFSYKGYPFSEIITIIFVLYIVIARRRLGSIHGLLLLAILYIFITFITAKERGYFLQSSFVNNYIRLVFYAIGTIVVPYYLVKKQNLFSLFKGVGWIIKLCCVLAIIEFLSKNILGIALNWQIPGISNGFTKTYVTNRVRTIFSEPAHFGIVTGVTTIFYLRYFRNILRRPNDYYFVIIAAIICLFSTLSLGSYTFLAIIIYLSYNDLIRSNLINPKSRNYIIFGITLIGCIIFSYLTLGGFLQEKIIDRIANIMVGEDLSAQHRLFGQFELVATGLKLYPVNGIGLGQNLAFLENGDFVFENFFFMKGYSKSSGVNNILTYILLQTGYVGFFIFLMYFFSLLYFDRFILITFFLMCFAWGYFNGPFFWFFIYMAGALKLDEKYRIKMTNRVSSKFQ